jgi:hypothetical protein
MNTAAPAPLYAMRRADIRDPPGDCPDPRRRFTATVHVHPKAPAERERTR